MSDVAADPTSAPPAPAVVDTDGVEVGDVVLVGEERHTDRLSWEAHEEEEDRLDADHEAAEDAADEEARREGKTRTRRGKRTRRPNPIPKLMRWFPAIVEAVLEGGEIIAHVFKASRGSGSNQFARGEGHGKWRPKGRK